VVVLLLLLQPPGQHAGEPCPCQTATTCSGAPAPGRFTRHTAGRPHTHTYLYHRRGTQLQATSRPPLRSWTTCLEHVQCTSRTGAAATLLTSISHCHCHCHCHTPTDTTPAGRCGPYSRAPPLHSLPPCCLDLSHTSWDQRWDTGLWGGVGWGGVVGNTQPLLLPSPTTARRTHSTVSLTLALLLWTAHHTPPLPPPSSSPCPDSRDTMAVLPAAQSPRLLLFGRRP
jgi:hypothetical protein